MDAPIHANRIRAYFSSFCSWACKRSDMDWNPIKFVRKPVEESTRERTLSLSEIVEVWQAADELGYPFGLATQILILTAALREDVARMRGRDIAPGHVGHLLWSVGGYFHGESVEFAIPIAPLAQEVLLKATASRPMGYDLIFTTTGITPISGWGHAKTRLDQLIRSRRLAKGRKRFVEMPSWRLNDFRRSFFDLSVDMLYGDQDILSRCLHRMSDFTPRSRKDWALSSDMLEARTHALFDWAGLVERSLVEARRRKPVRSRPSSAAARPAH